MALHPRLESIKAGIYMEDYSYVASQIHSFVTCTCDNNCEFVGHQSADKESCDNRSLFYTVRSACLLCETLSLIHQNLLHPEEETRIAKDHLNC